MSRYVDGFLIPVKKSKLRAYKKMAAVGKKLWMKHGALDYYECVGDDIKKTWGIPFPKLLKLKSDETVIWAFIVYKSKAHRNKVNKKVHADPEMQPRPEFKNVFDLRRFSMGGFKVFVRS